MRPLYINGKFLAQRVTGVQRFAGEVLRALDAEWPEDEAAVLLVPRGVKAPLLKRIAVEAVGPHRLPLHVWEQVVLPWRARAGLLLNLSGSAPALAVHRLATLHDAAVFDWPSAYSRPFGIWYRNLFRWIARRDPTLLTVSAFSRRCLAAALSLPESRFIVVPGAGEHALQAETDFGALERLGLVPGRYWLCVASRNPTKGLDVLERAAVSNGLAALACPVVIAGGDNRAVFSRGSRADEPGGPVRQAGVCSDAELMTLVREAFALIVPSRYEGFGLPMLEAMTLGCPVIATRAGALPEVGGDAAFWVPAEDAEALSAAMRQLGSSPSLRAELIEKGLARARTFAWARSARALGKAVELSRR
jgi:glycosyltransferase involved in cell wall biosynthesis